MWSLSRLQALYQLGVWTCFATRNWSKQLKRSTASQLRNSSLPSATSHSRSRTGDPFKLVTSSKLSPIKRFHVMRSFSILLVAKLSIKLAIKEGLYGMIRKLPLWSDLIKARWTRLAAILAIQSLLIKSVVLSSGSITTKDTSQVTLSRSTIQQLLKSSLRTSSIAGATHLTANLWCVWH